MRELGLQHETARDLYQFLRQEADGGTGLSWDDMPDWTGLWTWEARGGFKFDPETPPDVLTTAPLRPEFERRLEEEIERVQNGVEYDPISSCAPPGFPRWLAIPFLREHIVRPEQTWLTSETVNNVRRIYTDGRDHMPEDERYPLDYGDSIGFWNDHRLIIHTNQLKAGIYQRQNPAYSNEVETVEIWEKVDDRTIEVDVWVYDPPVLTEPWYTKHRFFKLSNPDNLLRVRYWDCGENQNNEVYETEEGGTQFSDFTFTDADDQ